MDDAVDFGGFVEDGIEYRSSSERVILKTEKVTLPLIIGG